MQRGDTAQYAGYPRPFSPLVKIRPRPRPPPHADSPPAKDRVQLRQRGARLICFPHDTLQVFPHHLIDGRMPVSRHNPSGAQKTSI